MRIVIPALAALALTSAATGALAQNADIIARSFADRVIGPMDGDAASLRVVVDRLHNRPRILHQGDIYQDGWVLRSITPDSATLAKGAQTLNIGLKPGATGDFAAAVRPVSLAVADDITAGDADMAAADGGTMEQQWEAARVASKSSRDTNAIREFDNLDPEGPDTVVMGTVYPGRIGADAMGPPGYISVTGYYLGKDPQGRFTFFRTLALFRAAGNTDPIQ